LGLTLSTQIIKDFQVCRSGYVAHRLHVKLHYQIVKITGLFMDQSGLEPVPALSGLVQSLRLVI